MRTLVELFHLVAGLTAAALLTAAAAWAYPLGREVIWWCGGVAMAATAMMGIGPLRRARAADRRR
ncbi:hypothetical protein D9601_01855 [Sphingomonas sp. MA1305]|uniref:hypothetical protein n=1 Tax=unclassified Sphingomonas TaxID=196159 RepID=UPI0018DFADE4|nr:hypothetical protein [Sphingomonas sp. MA1305]MBI0474111.1 hypothetical protein [Sphingomonas sp. MA1305]